MITPRYFVVFRNEQHMLESLNRSTNPLVAGAFNGAAIVDGKEEGDIEFWKILSGRRNHKNE